MIDNKCNVCNCDAGRLEYDGKYHPVVIPTPWGKLEFGVGTHDPEGDKIYYILRLKTGNSIMIWRWKIWKMSPAN